MDKSKRNLTKVLGAVGASAAVWHRPEIKSAVLPAHAETSDPATRAFTYSDTQGYDIAQNSVNPLPNQTFLFDVGDATPTGDGTVTISNFAGDIDDPFSEIWTIRMGGVVLGSTNNGTQCGAPAPDQEFVVTEAAITAAISSGEIEITATENIDINDICAVNTMDVTLSFPAEAPV